MAGLVAGPVVGDRYAYALWRRSEYIAWFPVPAILAALNVAEGLAPDAADGWGGAETVGGSPRGRGSRLTPAEVEAGGDAIVAHR